MSRLKSRRGSKVSDVFWHSEHFTRTKRESLNMMGTRGNSSFYLHGTLFLLLKTPACLDERHVHWFKKIAMKIGKGRGRG